jgi:LysR family nitrogen assimilation transcriptional regulator
MDIQRLEHFVKVVETGSFSKAAIALRMSQSALSRQIMELEESVGQPLLLRTGRGAVPTEAGQVLLAHARAILSIAVRAKEEIADLDIAPRGRVSLGMPPLMGLRFGADLVTRFHAKFPEARLVLVEGISLHLREWLLDGRLDAALLYDSPPLVQLDYEVLGREPLALFGPRSAPRLPGTIPVAKLVRYPLVLPSAPNAIRTLIDAALRENEISLKIIAEVAAAPTLLSLVSQGVAYTILPVSAARAAAPDQLQVARLVGPAIHNRVALAVPRTRPLSRLGRELIGLVRAVCGASA